MSELHGLAAPYVMDALDDAERQSYEAHLAGCDRCRTEVARLGAGVDVLADDVARQPPAELKAKIMEAVNGHIAEVVPVEPTKPTSRLWRWDWAFAAAAVVAVFFAGLLVIVSNQLDEAETVTAVLEAGDAVTVEFDSGVGKAVLVYSESLGRGVFVERTLVEPTGDRVYELWLVGEDGPAPAGVFRPESQQTLVVEGVQQGLTFAMTEEPAGGSEQPTGEILLSVEL